MGSSRKSLSQNLDGDSFNPKLNRKLTFGPGDWVIITKRENFPNWGMGRGRTGPRPFWKDLNFRGRICALGGFFRGGHGVWERGAPKGGGSSIGRFRRGAPSSRKRVALSKAGFQSSSEQISRSRTLFPPICRPREIEHLYRKL